MYESNCTASLFFWCTFFLFDCLLPFYFLEFLQDNNHWTMSEQCPPVGCIHRVVHSVQLVGCGKTFCTVHPRNELWKVFPPTFQPAGIDTAISDLVAATQPPEHIAAVTAYQRKLLKQADDTAASYEVLPCDLTRETLRNLLYLTTDCGALHKDNPLQQLNGVLARRFEDTDAPHGAAHALP